MTYKQACAWIAHSDNPGDVEPVEVLQSYITVALVAAMFSKDQAQVAKDVYAIRKKPR